MTARPPRSMSFTSGLASSIEAYLRMKEALGRRYAAERTILRALDRFMTTTDDDLTSDTFVAWNATLGRLTPGVRRNWLRVVRNLCLYRRRTIPDVFVPDPTGFPTVHLYDDRHRSAARRRRSPRRHIAFTVAPRDLPTGHRAALHQRSASRGARPPDRGRLRSE